MSSTFDRYQKYKAKYLHLRDLIESYQTAGAVTVTDEAQRERLRTTIEEGGISWPLENYKTTIPERDTKTGKFTSLPPLPHLPQLPPLPADTNINQPSRTDRGPPPVPPRPALRRVENRRDIASSQPTFENKPLPELPSELTEVEKEKRIKTRNAKEAIKELHNQLQTYQAGLACCQEDIDTAIKLDKFDETQKQFLVKISIYNKVIKKRIDELMAEKFPIDMDFETITLDNMTEVMDRYYDLFKEYIDIIMTNIQEFEADLNHSLNRNLPYFSLRYNLRDKSVTTNYSHKSGESKSDYEKKENEILASCNNDDCFVGNINTRFLKFPLIFREIGKYIPDDSDTTRFDEMKQLSMDAAQFFQDYRTRLENSRLIVNIALNSKDGKIKSDQFVRDTTNLREHLDTQLGPLANQVKTVNKRTGDKIKKNSESITKLLEKLDERR